MLNFKFIVKLVLSFGLFVLSLSACEEALFEPKLADEKVVVLSPAAEVKTFKSLTRFEWQKVEGVTRYQIQLASPTFKNSDFIIFDRIIDTTFTIDTLKQIGNYEWRVRGLSDKEMTPFTTLKIELVENPAFEFQNVNLVSPELNTLTNTLENTLTWEALSEAEEYEVQVLNASSEVIITQKTTNTNLELIFPEGESTWQVRGLKDEKITSFSTRKIIVDSRKPEKPILNTPINNSTITIADLEFTWTRNSVEGTKEKDSIYIFTDAAQTELKLKEEVETPYRTTLEADTYYWKVQSYDEAGNKSEESDVFTVIIN